MAQQQQHTRVVRIAVEDQPEVCTREWSYDLEQLDQPPRGVSRTMTATQRVWDAVRATRTTASQTVWEDKFSKGGLALEVMEASFTVKAAGGKKRILDNISLMARGGEMHALMGPSGAGKTTLLEFAALELKGGEATGSVTLNGMPLTFELFRQQAAYVDQFDTHWAFLTCREIMQFAAELYLPGDHKEQRAKVAHLMTQLGLVDCAGTRAGNNLFKGLSGGQRKRLTAAVAMLKSPAMLLLDEPTSGLDAASAAKTVGYLKELAESAKIIILATIHQPSTDVFMCFDRVTFLAGGRVTYSGLTRDVNDFCRDIGEPVPEMTNPADHWLKLTNNEFVGAEQVNRIVQDWRAKEASQPAAGDFMELPTPLVHAPCKQFCTVLRRQALLSLRDPTVYVARMLNFLAANCFFAFIYMHKREMTQDNVMAKINLHAWFFCLPSSLALAVVKAAHQDYTMVRKEVKNGLVEPSSYLLANWIVQLPYMILLAVFALGIPFLIAGFSYDALPQEVLVVAAMLFCFECMSEYFGVLFRNPLMGMAAMSGLWLSCFLFMGVSLPEDKIVWPFRIFCTIMPLKWTWQALTYLQFMGTTWKGAELAQNAYGFMCPNASPVHLCFGVTGEQVLESLKVSVPCVTTQNIVVRNVLIILAIAFTFKALYVASFLAKSLALGRARPAPARRVAVAPEGAEP